MIYIIVVGDKYNDGHDIHKEVRVEVNMSREAINEAYEKTTKEVGHCLFKDICTDYESSYVTTTQYKALVDAGVDFSSACGYDVEGDEDGEDGVWMEPDTLVCLYLEMARVHLSGLQYQIIVSDTQELTARSIGYGLFS